MSGAGLGQGDATTVAWTIVRDGTPIPVIGYPGTESADPSNLVAFLDDLYGTTTPNGDPQNASWFPLFQSSFDRWSALGGITFVYTSFDDGAPFSAVGSAYPGEWGGRADVRIGGHRIDGPSGIIAYNFLPNNGEMVIDTDETYYDNISSNSLRLRNTIMHEAGHGFGLEHVISSTNGFLMHPAATTSFDGPQFDDILGLHRHYGDRYEKGTGNNTSATSTTLGTLNAGSTLSVGTDAGLAAVSVTQTDFVSIDDESDVDFYKFTVSAATTISINLSPKGPTYTFGQQGGSESSFNASAQSDLSLQLIGTNGSSILSSANSTGLGGNESIANFSLPAAGTYYVRVGGATSNKVQMYRLDVSDVSASASLTVALNPSSVSEAAGSSASTGTVTRSGDLSSAVTVTLTSGDTTEATVPATVTIPAGQASATFTIAAVDDAVVDGSQSVVLTAAATGYSSGTANLSVTDNDVLTLTLSINKSSFAENAGSNAATGTVSRNSADLTSALTITLTSSDTSELTVPATVTIPAGQSSVTFAINAVDDSIVDGSQSVTITAAATNYTAGTSSISVTDNDVLTLSYALNKSSIAENAGTNAATATITRNAGDVSAQLVVTLTNGDSSEVSIPASVIIPAGQSSVTFAIDAVDDLLADGTQIVSLSASAAGYVAGNASIDVTDNEVLALTVTVNKTSILETAGAGAATGTVTRNSADLSSQLIVTLTSSDTTEVTLPATVTIPAGQASVTFAMAAVDDLLVDGTQTVSMTAAATNYTSGTAAIDVIDNDSLTLTLTFDKTSFSEATGASAATGTISRNSANVSSELIVTLTSNNSDRISVPTTVTIPAGQSSATFAVTAVNNGVVDGNANATITASAINYNSASAQLSVTDDDVLTLALTFNKTSFAENAGAAAATGTVSRNATDLSSAVVVTISSGDTTESTGPATVTIPAGQSSATFSIDAVDDTIVDGTKTVTYTVAATDYVSGTNTIDVTDNDSLTLSVSLNKSSFAENAGSSAATGTVTRNAENLGSSLTVTLTSGDTTEATVPATITIPAGQTSATFTIAAVDDAVVDGTQSVTFTAAATNYTSGSASLNVTDNDVLTLSVSLNKSSFAENAGASAATGTVSRNNADLSSALTVTLTSSDTSEATVPASITIPAGQASANFTIAAVDDAIVDGTQNVTFTAAATSYTAGTASVSVTDDDAASLSLTINKTSFAENAGSNAATGTVTRNTSDLSSALTVTLTSDDTSEATVPASVTIPAGQATASFAIDAVDDALVDGTKSVLFTAAATNFVSGTRSLDVTDNDTLTLTVSLNKSSFAENAGSSAATGTVTRNSENLGAALTVTLTSSDTTEATVPASITIPAGQASATFTIAAVDDAIVDGTQNVTFSAAATSYTAGSAALGVTDNDVLTLTFTMNKTAIAENAGSAAATGTITRNAGDLTSALVVTLTSADTTEATAPATATIPAGQSSVTFNINAVDDALVDGTKSVLFTAAATNYVSGTRSLDVTDNDTLTLTVSLDKSSFAENAGSSAATGTVTRNSENLGAALTITLTSSDTTEATLPASITIPAGQASATFTIAAVDDAIVDGTQNVTFSAAATSYTAGSAALGVTDNDVLTLAFTMNKTAIAENAGSAAATGTITRNAGDLTSALVVTLTSADTTEATAPATVTIPAGQSSVTFNIDAVDDALVDGTKSVLFTAAATNYVSGTRSLDVTDNDTLTLTVSLNKSSFAENAGSSAATGTVTRNSENLGSALTVTLTSSDTTEATVPASITIPAGQASATFTIAAVDDAIVDGTQNVTFSASAASYTAGSASLGVTDNDVLTLAFTMNKTAIAENAGSAAATGTITRNAGDLTSALVVTLTSADTTEATAPATVTIPAGQSSVTFNINAVDDALVDGTKSVLFTAAATNYVSGTRSLDVTDNDTLTLTVSLNKSSFAENAGSSAATGTVTRNSENLGAALTITLTSSDTTEATVPASITIPAGQASATFTIAAVDDAIVDGTQNVTFNAAATSYTAGSASVGVTDNDALSLTLLINKANFAENSGQATATGTIIRNSGDLTSAVTVTVTSADTSEATAPATVTIPAGESSVTFAIDAVDDVIVDGDVLVTFTAAATGFDDAAASVTVLDNDFLTLFLGLNRSTINEGDGANAATGTVTRNSLDLSSPLVVTLNSTDPTEASVSQTVTIPAGEASATFPIRAIEDAIVDGTQTAVIEVSADGFFSGNQSIEITDNDVLLLTVSINKSSVSENAGANAAVGTVSRNNSDLSSALVVTLASSDTSEATTVTSVTIPAGQASATFAIDAVDDQIVDGTQTATFTASAAGYTPGSANLNVTDDDTLELTITLNKPSIAENAGVNAAVGTVSRNAGNLSSSLLVQLSSNDTSEATVPTSVVIPAGQSSVTFPVNAIDDTIVDGTQPVTITGTATNYVPATASLLVTDNDTLNRPNVNPPSGPFLSLRPELTWDASEGATSYDIWLGNQTTKVNPYLLVNTSGTSFTPASDMEIGTYNLWMRARNATSDSPWTTQVNFRIAAPVTMQPMDRWQPTSRPTLVWDALPGAVRYDLWISTAGSSSSIYLRDQNVTGTSFTPSADMPIGLYRVWVRGIAADGVAAMWSAMTEFNVATMPTVTQGTLPTFDRTPTLGWSAVTGANSYEVFVRNLNNGATVYYETGVTQTTWTPPADLADGPYRWWVLAVGNQGIRSLWSAPTDIYVGGRPNLLAPSTSSGNATPTLLWQPVDGAVRYELWVNQLSNGIRVIHETELTSTSYVPTSNLASGEYRMWVRAVSNTNEVSVWSLALDFSVAANEQKSSDAESIADAMVLDLLLENIAANFGTVNDNRHRLTDEESEDWYNVPAHAPQVPMEPEKHTISVVIPHKPLPQTADELNAIARAWGLAADELLHPSSPTQVGEVWRA